MYACMYVCMHACENQMSLLPLWRGIQSLEMRMVMEQDSLCARVVVLEFEFEFEFEREDVIASWGLYLWIYQSEKRKQKILKIK